MNADTKMLRNRTAFSGVKYKPYCLISPPGKPHKSKLFYPLSRHIRPLFPHVLGVMSAGDPVVSTLEF